jgi:DNA polymerase-1
MLSPMVKLDDFREVVLLDTEFVARDGDRVLPVCLVAHELQSGRRHRLFFDDPHATYENPLPVGGDILYVAYSAPAELSTFLALGWSLPEHVLDLFVEFRCATNGLTKANGSPVESSLIAALMHYGLDSMTVLEKVSMVDLILRGHPYSTEEQQLILDYCAQDVEALEKLLPVMLPGITLLYAIFRGWYTKAVANMEFSGIPIDVPNMNRLLSRWDALKEKLALDIEAEHAFGVYQGTRWSNDRFGSLLDRMGILNEWPRTPSGLLCVEDEDIFEPMAMRFPALAPLRELRSTLTHLRQLKVTVGRDGRNRCSQPRQADLLLAPPCLPVHSE